ncbi:beta-lactamase-like protein [Pseudomassariella vexata]|uniref:Beta-lactamase-like protein n=1 Tax=Pseudomassariella vexata TaxID=1141098 RepID=A0A1Y2EBS5_9PEZI|nr:beta-lactamase-like protein [Pseudomassariella vexata]ORY69029.1 beta-lactamase-like protein [Pseudomassariella vexata]
MPLQDITPEAAPPLGIPKQGGTCSLSIIDTTCSLTVPAKTLVEPAIPGHELINLPTVAFLITHSASGRQLLFDLGCRKDFWNLPRPIAEIIDAKVPGIKVDRNLVDILIEGGMDIANLEAAIVSHHHYDHIGDPSTFPASMDLVVGPGFSVQFLPGYPTSEASPAFENAFEGRSVREMTFSDQLTVAGFRAHDYFADGSLYILDSPGHAIGHLSALVRTTSDTFVFLGGDICHFNGAFRPTKYVPMPPLLLSPTAYACSLFTGCHPDPSNARTSPYYKPCSSADSWYLDPPRACQSIEHLKALDADDRVLVLIAHDPSIMNKFPFFPNGVLDDWHEAGWKQGIRWRFLDELPVDGKAKEYLVSGTYMNGKMVKTLDGTKVE